jgi:LPS-assembly protein
MEHLSIRIAFLLPLVLLRVPYRLRASALAVALAGLSGAAYADDNEPVSPPAPALKPAPELTPPPLRPPPGTAPAKPAPGAPAGAAPPATQPAAIGPRAPFAADSGAIFFRANDVEGISNKEVTATGKVELRTRRETVLADWLHYDFVTDEIWAKGDVTLRQGIDWITGPEVRFKRGAETGAFESPRFYIGENASRGSATEIRFTGPDTYEASNAQYTTCVAPRDDWFIRMGELEVDKMRNVGTGHDATLVFLGAPVIHLPWVEFPLSSERKSGFLTPVLGSSGARGFDATMPYYLNLAPNYDATLTPRIMTKRGFQLGGQFRYLLAEGLGDMEAEYLPHDQQTGTDRYLMSWKHTQSFDTYLKGLSGYLNLNKVSDDAYFTDLSDRVSLTSLTTLPREGGIAYTNGQWGVVARAQAFQTLQDPTAPQPLPYNRVPQVQGTLAEYDWLGLTWAGIAEYAYFRQPTLTTGQRVYAWPTVGISRQGAAWYVNARTGVHVREYDLNEVRPDLPNRQSYAIPITSVDAGLVFEREVKEFGLSGIQTLEPRAFYVYVPYKNQSNAPTFDTAIDDFNFAQLFSVNRYLGNDRIGDANQLSLALTSRLLDADTGAERMRVSVGERFYFNDQRVVLNETPRAANNSDFLVGMEGRITDAWALISLWQYNFEASQTERFNAGVRYTPAPGRTLSVSYRYSRQNFDPLAGPIGDQSQINQWDVAGQWPVDENWTLLGRWNYSILGSKTLEAVAGVEYNAGCWILRLVGQRLTTTTQTATNSVYLQIELNGLARFGTSPLELLRRSVPGYLKTNDPTVSPRDRSSDAFPEF